MARHKPTDMRDRMVEEQLVERRIEDVRVLDAMRKVPRHCFVDEMHENLAYEDMPLPIGEHQTISQPYMVALMTEALQLKGGERMLEVGTGSGYAAAVLAEIVDVVYTIERIKPLADRARQTRASLGYENVHVIAADGTLGWPDAAPYEGIVVTAGGPRVPSPLKEQLSIGGRLVIPVEHNGGFQELIRVTRVSENEYGQHSLDYVLFVPLIGEEGWHLGGGRDHRDPALLGT